MNSIRRRLTRDLVVTLASLLGLGMVAIFLTVWFALEQSFDDALRARATAVAALTEVEAGKVAFDFSDDFLRGYGAKSPRNYFELWDSANAVLTRSPSLHQADLKLRDLGPAERPKFWNFTLPNGRPGRAVAFTFAPTLVDRIPAPPEARELRILAAVDREDFNETLAGLLAGIAGWGLVLIGAVFGVVPRVLRRGLEPLDQFGDQAARIDAESLATRFSADTLPAELQPIVRRLNDLLARLEQSFERERRFSADLAHELRTPLTELRTLAESALKWPESRDAATDSDTLAIAQQMEAIVSHMLALARGEQGQIDVGTEPIQLEKFVPEVWEAFAVRASQRQLNIRFALPPVSVTADPALLRSILSNLFDNAVEYSTEGGDVNLVVENSDGRAVLHLANTTDRLEAADVGRMFDRLWRKEDARSGGRHIGLGLSLARMMAAAMGWQLSAELQCDGIVVFTLRTSK